MASFKRDGDVWRVQLYVLGHRESGTFHTKKDATAWAAQRETELRLHKKAGVIGGRTVADAFKKYEAEVSKKKRNYLWEAQRFAALVKLEIGDARMPLGDIKLTNLTKVHLAQFRDARLKSVKASSVNRDLTLLSHVFNTARKEWHWIAESPTKDVRRPANPPPRDRRPTDDEIKRLCEAMGFDEVSVQNKSQATAVAFLFAIETAMRMGEICALRPSQIEGRVAQLKMTKNGLKRDVPLSTRALQLLSYLPPVADDAKLFGLTESTLDRLFREAKITCAIEGLTFHDTRHEAITRLAKKLNVLELARMVGHRDLKMLQIYYNESAAEIAQRLD